MAYELNTPRTYFKIKDGKIVVRDHDTQVDTFYDSFSGYLQSIDYVQSVQEYKGKKVTMKSFKVVFADSYSTDALQHIWSPSPTSPIFFAFLNCILNIKDFTNVKLKLKPYLKDGQQRLIVYANGVKLDWKYAIKDVPPITKMLNEKNKPILDINGNQLWNHEARFEWLEKKTNEVNQLLGKLTGNTVLDDDGGIENAVYNQEKTPAEINAEIRKHYQYGEYIPPETMARILQK